VIAGGTQFVIGTLEPGKPGTLQARRGNGWFYL
jgi:hypothetical protein